jgi:hypothetical protein
LFGYFSFNDLAWECPIVEHHSNGYVPLRLHFLSLPVQVTRTVHVAWIIVRKQERQITLYVYITCTMVLPCWAACRCWKSIYTLASIHSLWPFHPSAIAISNLLSYPLIYIISHCFVVWAAKVANPCDVIRMTTNSERSWWGVLKIKFSSMHIRQSLLSSIMFRSYAASWNVACVHHCMCSILHMMWHRCTTEEFANKRARSPTWM